MPDGVSSAVPQIRADVQPAVQPAALYEPPLAGNVSTLVGADVSMRIWVAAVLTASALPRPSTERYLIVYTPEVSSGIDVPSVDAAVGVEPSVVKYVWATPEPTSVGLRVTVCAAVFQPFPIVAVL